MEDEKGSTEPLGLEERRKSGSIGSEESSESSSTEESDEDVLPEASDCKRKGSTASLENIESDTETDQVDDKLERAETPVEEQIDKGLEADSESDQQPTTSKSLELRKKKTKRKTSPKKKSKAMKRCTPEGKRKRPKSDPNKRKKIRKLLTEDKLKQETLQALREEEERQKRLGSYITKPKDEIQNHAGISMELLENNTNADFAGLDYGFDLLDSLYMNIEPMSDVSLDSLSQLPPVLSESSNVTSVTMTESLASMASPVATVTPSLNTNSVTIKTSDEKLTALFEQTSQASVTALQKSDDAPKFGTATLSGSVLQTPIAISSTTLPVMCMPSTSSMQQSTTLSSSFTTPMPNLKIDDSVQPTAAVKPAAQQSDVICISSDSSDEEKKRQAKPICTKPVQNGDTICISSGSESTNDDVIFAGTDDNDIVEEEPDVNNSGMHVNDSMNQPDLNGQVLVNKNRPPDEPEIYLSPHLARAVKPHQIGGIRFMFDNIVESLEHYNKSNGFGCILAHSMGLGKTLQVISFIDIFLRHTGAKTVLCIVPVNTLLNWIAEFEMWLPQTKSTVTGGESDSKRTFKVRLLSDTYKTTEARAQVISSWKNEGGVLLMGYEMFRLLTNQKSRRRRKKKSKNGSPSGLIDTIDLEEEDRLTELTTQIYEDLVKPGSDLIVCDEGHRIKNSHAGISQALKQVDTRRRIVLTGYPLQNNLIEYWCMVDFVRPNFLGTKQEFSNMFERPICNGQCADSNESDIRLMRFRSHVLHSLLKGFVQRRSHLVLRNSLPPKEEYVLLVRMSPWQKKLYNTFIETQKQQGSGSFCSSLNPIKAFSICCKIWNHPDVLYRAIVRKTLEEQHMNDGLLDLDLDLPEAIVESFLKKARRKREAREKAEVPGSNGKLVHSVGFSPFEEEKEKGINYDWALEALRDYQANRMDFSGKMLILMNIIELSVLQGDKILVFSQSLTTLTLIEEFLADLQVPTPPNEQHRVRKWSKNESYFRLDGNTSTTDREKMIQSFNKKDNNVYLFLLSTRAGCLGINLVGANRVVLFDISWNPCHDAQAVCRVYRYGQTKKCVIYRLISDQSMEKKIYDRQISKQGMSDRVVDELNPIQSLERQDIRQLLVCDENELPAPTLQECADVCNDDTLIEACKVYSKWLTRTPFHHESLLMDCKGSRLTQAEKRAAQKGYEQEKRASLSCNYSRPSYVGFYAAAGYPQKTTAGSKTSIFSRSNTTAPSDRPVANVRPMHSTPYPMQIRGNSGTNSPDQQIIGLLQRSGITVRKTVAMSDIPLPHSTSGPNSKPLVAAGEAFYTIQGTEGMYVGTTTGRIFALRSRKTHENDGPSPLIQGPGGQMLTSRERESQIIKSAFNTMIRRNPAIRQPMRNQYMFQQSMPSNYPQNTDIVQSVQSTGAIGQNSTLNNLTMNQQNMMNIMTPSQNANLQNQQFSANQLNANTLNNLTPDTVTQVNASDGSNSSHFMQHQNVANTNSTFSSPHLTSLLGYAGSSQDNRTTVSNPAPFQLNFLHSAWGSSGFFQENPAVVPPQQQFSTKSVSDSNGSQQILSSNPSWETMLTDSNSFSSQPTPSVQNHNSFMLQTPATQISNITTGPNDITLNESDVMDRLLNPANGQITVDQPNLNPLQHMIGAVQSP